MDNKKVYFSPKYSGSVTISDKSGSLELVFKDASGIDYDDFVTSIRSLVWLKAKISKLEQTIMELESDGCSIFVQKTKKGVELCIINQNPDNDYRKTIEKLFEKCDDIKSAIPLKLDDFKNKIRSEFRNSYKKDVENRSYAEKLDLHIEEQIQMLSEGLGELVGYVLTHPEIEGIVTCIQETFVKLMSDEKPAHSDARNYVRIISLGMSLLKRYGSEECDIDDVQELETYESSARDYFHSMLCEGLDSPYIASVPNTDTKSSSLDLTDEQKILAQTASLEGRLAQAVRKQDYDGAANIKKQIDELKKK